MLGDSSIAQNVCPSLSVGSVVSAENIYSPCADYTLCMQHAKSGRLVTIGYATRDAAQLPGSMRVMSPSKSVSKLNTASMPRDSHSATIDASVKLMSWSSYRRNASRDA